VTVRDGNCPSELGRYSKLADEPGEMAKYFAKDMIAIYI
jgi:hypothetical protein